MMRRISLVAASAAMLALSALPASAATMGSATATATHKLSFPGLSGVKAWGNYAKVSRGIKINVCAEDMTKSIFAVGAVTVASNAANSLHANVGAVSIGYHQTVCRSMTLRYSAHLQLYTFTANNKGMMTHKTKLKKVF